MADFGDAILTEPFHVVYKRLLLERGITSYALARILRERYGWGSSPATSQIERGLLVPKLERMRQIAEVLEAKPEVFAEYRLALVREQLDWRAVGLEEAVRALEGLKR